LASKLQVKRAHDLQAALGENCFELPGRLFPRHCYVHWSPPALPIIAKLSEV
jgi:hypothetical protein